MMPQVADMDNDEEFDEEIVFRKEDQEGLEEPDAEPTEQENNMQVANPSDFEVKGIHFKICNPGVAECKILLVIFL